MKPRPQAVPCRAHPWFWELGTDFTSLLCGDSVLSWPNMEPVKTPWGCCPNYLRNPRCRAAGRVLPTAGRPPGSHKRTPQQMCCPGGAAGRAHMTASPSVLAAGLVQQAACHRGHGALPNAETSTTIQDHRPVPSQKSRLQGIARGRHPWSDQDESHLTQQEPNCGSFQALDPNPP